MSKRTYRAFISYSHRDAKWGKWLQSALENYRIPKDMVGRKATAGIVPENLRPIFRDRLDLSAGPSLQNKLDEALEASENLIVICSPTSAQSQYVNEEVRRFKAMGKADRILAFIVDGLPGLPGQECFPPALRFAVDAKGVISDEPSEPVGADVRNSADGKTLAKLKIISGLLGLDLDDLRKREEIAERRRKRVLFAVAASMAGLAVAASATAAWNYFLLTENQSLVREQVKLLDGTLDRATELVDQAVTFSRREGIPATLPKEILRQVELMFQDLVATNLGRESATLKAREAIMLLRIAENRGVLGDTRLREQYVRRVVDILEPLVRDAAAPKAWHNDLAWGYTELGVVYRTRGNLKKALESINKGFEMRKALVESDPSHHGWRGSLSNSHTQIGDIQYVQGDLAGALKSYRTALDIKDELAAQSPENSVLKSELSSVHMKLGLVHQSNSNPQAAQAAFDMSLEILRALTAAEPLNAYWRRDLSVVQDHIGDLHLGQEDVSEARRWYEACLNLRKRLAEADPNNVTFQSDLAFAHTNFGALFSVEEKWDKALAEQNEALEIRRRLHEQDRLNAEWRFNLGLSHRLIGDVLFAKGELEKALGAYKRQQEIIQTLVEEDPSNLAWQRYLARNFGDIGSMLANIPDPSAAITAYEQAVAIEERLARLDTANGAANENLYAAYGKIAHLHAALGRAEDEVAAYERARDAALRLVEQRKDDSLWRSRVARMLERIGDAWNRQEKFEAAATAYDESLAIRQELARSNPDDLKLSGNLAVRYLFTGHFHDLRGRRDRALALFGRGRDIARDLVERDPDTGRWQKILDGLETEIARLESQSAAH